MQRDFVCVERIEETANAATFVFDAELAGVSDYKPGQFTSLQVAAGQENLQRAYTLSSTPSRPGKLAVTIKRVEGGKMSNLLMDSLKPGMRIFGTEPMGAFNLFDGTQSKQYLFVSAGSGITPVMSMSRYLLDTQADSSIHFLHCARSLDDLIFAEELQQMAAEHSNFKLELVLSDIQHPDHHFGFLDHAMLQQLVPSLSEQAVYTCGPQPFMDMLADSLEQRGFDMARFHQESFGGPGSEKIGAANESSAGQYQVEVPAFGKTLEVPANGSLLEALEQGGVPIIGACRSGVCGSCKCKVTKGSVESSSQMTLTPEQIAEGYVLACSSTVVDDLAVELS